MVGVSVVWLVVEGYKQVDTSSKVTIKTKKCEVEVDLTKKRSERF